MSKGIIMEAHPIHIGIGGWDYDPWRGTFYPEGLPKTRQLGFASSRLTAIEVNATYYKLQRPELFERWADETPDNFVFTIKGSRYCSNRKLLGESGEAIARFCEQGFTRLGGKLGPILWQLMATKKFDPDDVAAFFALLPRECDGVPLRHAIEAQHESFGDPRFADLAREAGVAICLVDDPGRPPPSERVTADFVYARLKSSAEAEPAGYSPAALDEWARRAGGWAREREVFMFVIAGAKVRAPAAAQELIARVDSLRSR